MIKLIKPRRKQDSNKHIPYSKLAQLDVLTPQKSFNQTPSIHQSGQNFQPHFNLLLFHARIFESATPLAIPCQGARVIIRFRRSSCKGSPPLMVVPKVGIECLSRYELRHWFFFNCCCSIKSMILEVKNSSSFTKKTKRSRLK